MFLAFSVPGFSTGIYLRFSGVSALKSEEFSADSLRRSPPQQKDKKDKQEKPEKPKANKPEVIKEVPRSRKQPKPRAVVDKIRSKRPPASGRPGGKGHLRVR